MTKLNPAIAWILRSPLHPLLSAGLMLVTVTGRRSGRRYAIPVGYQRHGDEILVLVSKAPRKQWWRNYLEPRPIELCLRGRQLRGDARVVAATSPEFRDAVEATLRRMPWLRRHFGISYRRGGALSDEQWRTLAEQAAMVKVALAPGAEP